MRTFNSNHTMPTLEKQFEEAMVPVIAQPKRICPKSMGWAEDSDHVGCRATHITHMVNRTLEVPAAVTHINDNAVIVDFGFMADPRARRYVFSKARTGICITKSVLLMADNHHRLRGDHTLTFNGGGDLTSVALCFDSKEVDGNEILLQLPTGPLLLDGPPHENVRYHSSASMPGVEGSRKVGQYRSLTLEVLTSVKRRKGKGKGNEETVVINKPLDPRYQYPEQPERSLPCDDTGRRYMDSRLIDHLTERDVRTGQVTDLSRRVPVRGATIHELFEVFRRQVNDAVGQDVIAELPKAA